MFDQSECNDLCVNCSESPHCMYKANSRYPISYCEEYYVSSLSCKQTNASPNADKMSSLDFFQSVMGQDTHAAALKQTNDSVPSVINNLKGLCSSCNHWQTCTFPKSSKGVIDCEEFE